MIDITDEMVLALQKSLRSNCHWVETAFAREALTAALAASKEGWQLVPKEPTEEMMVAGELAAPEYASFADMKDSPSYVAWKAMLAAAPSVSGQESD